MRRQRVRRGVLVGSFALFQSSRLVHLMFSPVLLLLAAAHGVVGGSMLVYGALFASSLFLGRAFCGWACPGCGLQEVVALKVRRPVRSRGSDRVKWGIAAALSGQRQSSPFGPGACARWTRSSARARSRSLKACSCFPATS
jgi:hypothetical protein